jgi:putative inorganic carbon (hco3(-)) transporter
VLKTLSIIPRYIIFFLLIFTPLARGGVQGWAVTVVHIAVLLALTAFFLEKSLTWKWRWISTPLDKPILALVVLCTLSTIFSLHFQTSFWAMVLLIDYIIVFYLVIHLIRTRSEIRQLIYVIIGVATFLAVFGLFKVSGNNPFSWWHYPEITQHTNRVSATYGNANHLAGYMEMAIPLMLGLLVTGIRGGQRLLFIGILFFLFLALMLSLSRGGWIGAFVGLFFMTVVLTPARSKKRKRVVFGLIGCTLVASLFILSSTATVERIVELEEKKGLSARSSIWGGTISMIQDYPLLGAGPGMYSTVYTQYQPAGFVRRYFFAHNDYLQFASEAGIFLFPIQIWLLSVLYKKGFRKMRSRSRLVWGITVGSMAGITAILFHTIYDFNLHIPANAMLFGVLAALVVSPVPKENTSNERK